MVNGAFTEINMRGIILALTCLIPVLLLLSELVTAVHDCPPECDCKHHVATCTCNNETTDLHIISFQFQPSPSELVITDCETVVLYRWIPTNPDTQLHKVHVQRVDRLLVKEDFITGCHKIVSISVEHCGQVSLEETAFANSQGIDRLNFVNVTITSIPKHTFDKLDRVGHFGITNSSIGTVRSGAFGQIGNVNHFSVANTAIRSLEPNSIEVSTVGDFAFKNVTVEEWSSKAVVLSDIGNLMFRNVHVEELQMKAMVVNKVTNFSIVHCRFDLVRFHAFGSLTGIQNLSVINNTFQNAESGSVILPLPEISHLKVDSNRFHCSHKICWLVEGRFDRNNPFLENSICNGPSNMTGKSLATFGSVGLDDEDMCGDEFSGDSEIPVSTTDDVKMITTVKLTTVQSGYATPPKITSKVETKLSSCGNRDASKLLIVAITLWHFKRPM